MVLSCPALGTRTRTAAGMISIVQGDFACKISNGGCGNSRAVPDISKFWNVNIFAVLGTLTRAAGQSATKSTKGDCLMFKSLTSMLSLVAVLGVLAAPCLAKDSAEIQAEADRKAAEAAAVGSEATAESTRSAAAQVRGKEGRAAKHAREAAEKARKADRIQADADELQRKADKKLRKEMR